MSENVNKIFNETKKNILGLIKNSNFEITNQTKENKSGIYMIYIDNFSDNKIIPVYVGQAIDIQKRYKEHYKEIISLNRLSYDAYSFYNEIGFYDGAFKSCKIFKYMVEHNCLLRDYHFIVLEYCDKELLEEREQFYIQTLKSEYFGFNQLNAKTLWMPYAIANRTNEKDVALRYILAVQENCRNMKSFIDYGFTEFNYNYAFHYEPFSCEIDDAEISKELDVANQMIKDLTLKIDSEYINRKKSNDIAMDKIYDEEINYDRLIELKKQRKQISKDLREKFLSIDKKYTSFPLEDNVVGLSLDNEIYFTISNDGKNNRPAEIIKIDYNIDGKQKEFYIDNKTTQNIVNGMDYVEKSFSYQTMGFQRAVYKVIPKKCYEDYMGLVYPHHISTSSEFKTGINDFSIKDKTLCSLKDVIKEIISEIKSGTKIKAISSETKKILGELLEEGLTKKIYLQFKELIKL